MNDHPLDDLTPQPGRSLGSANYGATSQVIALERGQRWRCGRVNAWVNCDECLARYIAAKNADGYCPCLECATVARLLKKKGGNMAKATTKAAVKATTKKAVQAAPKKAPARQEKASDIFGGWDLYQALQGSSTSKPAARLTKNEVFLNLPAHLEFGLGAFLSVDVYYRPGRIGMRLYPDRAGALRLSVSRKKNKNGRNSKFSSPGMVRDFGLQKYMGKRYAVRQLAPDALEIDLTEEV